MQLETTRKEKEGGAREPASASRWCSYVASMSLCPCEPPPPPPLLAVQRLVCASLCEREELVHYIYIYIYTLHACTRNEKPAASLLAISDVRVLVFLYVDACLNVFVCARRFRAEVYRRTQLQKSRMHIEWILSLRRRDVHTAWRRTRHGQADE